MCPTPWKDGRSPMESIAEVEGCVVCGDDIISGATLRGEEASACGDSLINAPVSGSSSPPSKLLEGSAWKRVNHEQELSGESGSKQNRKWKRL